MMPLADSEASPKVLHERIDLFSDYLVKYQRLWDARSWSIDGEWTPVSSARNGIETKAPKDEGLRVSIRNGRMTTSSQKKTDQSERTFTIMPDRNPRAIDLATSEERGGMSNGIYRIQGDELTLCLTNSRSNRPTEFTAEKGSPNELLVLRRVPKSPLDGEWVEVSHRLGGEATDVKAGGYRWRFDRDRVVMTIPGQADTEATFKLRPDLSPTAIDLQQKDKGIASGLYRLKGDELVLCFSETVGDNRPSDFQSEKGSNNHLIVLKKKDEQQMDR
jgi:uncharacterized protein (TIGR03067 family)